MSLACAAFGTAGCEQDDGDSCQVTRDCADGLICVVSMGSVRGICRSELPEDAGTCDPATNEGSCPPADDSSLGDASLGGDASMDAGGDASQPDGGDASQPDGGDASPPNDDDAGG